VYHADIRLKAVELAGDDQFGRASVYMESLETVGLGSLVLFDALHVPSGVSAPRTCNSVATLFTITQSAQSGPRFSCKVPVNGPQVAKLISLRTSTWPPRISTASTRSLQDALTQRMPLKRGL
jgi:hypothetical protein